MLEAFDHIEEVTAESHTPVLVIVFPMITEAPWSDYDYLDLHRQVAAAAREREFRALDLYDQYAAHEPDSLRVSATDPHPNALGHAVAARALHAWVDSTVVCKSRN